MTEAEWAALQTNRALSDHRDIDIACDFLAARGLPLHPDRPKNWDSFLAHHHTYNRCSFVEPILDAGAGDESAYLPGLKKRGFKDLIGINLDRKDDYKAGVRDGIRYVYGDITSTPFPNQIFGFVSCLSVIEHGVDWRAFLLEMSRILKIDAQLFISCDYWPEKIDTTGLITHDAPINIFSATEVRKLLSFADTCGLGLVGQEWNNAVGLPVIQWAGCQYTFMNLLFRRYI
jgi:SAM-dependent methyltransferase